MKKILLFAALAVFSISHAQAYDRFEESDDGGGTIYGGVSFGKTKIGSAIDTLQQDSDGNLFVKAIDCASGDCDDTNWKVFAGYDITSNLAVEAAYRNITKDSGPSPYKIKITGMSASGLYNVPVAENLKVFGKVGAMTWDLTDDNGYYGYFYDKDGTDILLGAGATYKFGDNWGIRGEYEHLGGELDAGMYSVGAVFSSM